MTRDAFETAALRAAVLEAWRASPARLREDANTEEDHARGYYRDRVLVELAQNAADAATRAGVPGRLLLRLAETVDGAVLIAANTGAPLDADGVASLASMRASAKRDDAAGQDSGARVALVGRFGVGFAAVRAVADEVSVLSTSGGVRFSLGDTAELLARASADVPALADEVRRRDGSLPALRLPLPAEGAPPVGYDTAVVLELRDEVAADEVRALLAAVGDPLLLALPGLVEIVVEDDDADHPVRRVANVGERWRVAAAQGELDLALLADRPVEERSARTWRVTWAVPRPGRAGALAPDGGPGSFWPTVGAARVVGAQWDRVVHAPTPTDEPCTVPALLVATLPLDPARRHVAPGPLTDAVLDHAADVYAQLAVDVVADGGDPLELVPTGFAAGPLDGALRDRLVERLARTPLLVSAASADAAGAGPAAAPEVGVLLEPRQAVALTGDVGRDETAVGALAVRATGLVLLAPGTEAAARTLGVEMRELSDLVEELPAMHSGPPEEWRTLYAALAPLAGDSAVREALGGLPVPLTDGRVVRGARGLVQLADDAGDDAGNDAGLVTTGMDRIDVLTRWGLRVVHPAARHALLTRLGADELGTTGLLAHPAVRQAVLDVSDDDDLELARDVTEAVLTLVTHAVRGGSYAVPSEIACWLGLLTIMAADGEPTPAQGLVLPGSVAAGLFDHRVLAPVELATVERWGASVLVAAGVRDDLVVVRVVDVVADPELLELDGSDAGTLAAQSLDGWEDYTAELARALGRGAYVPEVVAVADLDAVDPDSWPDVLVRLATRPELRRALLDPVRGEGAGGREASSYTAWWLRARSGLGLDRPCASSDADAAVRRLLPSVPPVVGALDARVQRALGAVASLTALDAHAWTRVLDGLGSAGSPVDVGLAAAVWRAWAASGVAGPELVPAIVGDRRVAMVHADDAAVADAPMWLQRTDVAAMVPVVAGAAAAVAELLDLPLASDLALGEVETAPEHDADLVPTPASALALVPGAPTTWVEHEVLHVDGAPVEWWVEGDGPEAIVHATHLAALARGLAQAAGCWSLRHVLEIVLTDPVRADDLALESTLDPPGARWSATAEVGRA